MFNKTVIVLSTLLLVSLAIIGVLYFGKNGCATQNCPLECNGNPQNCPICSECEKGTGCPTCPKCDQDPNPNTSQNKVISFEDEYLASNNTGFTEELDLVREFDESYGINEKNLSKIINLTYPWMDIEAATKDCNSNPEKYGYASDPTVCWSYIKEMFIGINSGEPELKEYRLYKKDDKQTIIWKYHDYDIMGSKHCGVEAIYFVKVNGEMKIVKHEFLDYSVDLSRATDCSVFFDGDTDGRFGNEECALTGCITSNPSDEDTDNDGWLDGTEAAALTNPQDSKSFPK